MKFTLTVAIGLLLGAGQTAQAQPAGLDIDELRALAEQGDPDAQGDLATLHAWGAGVPQDQDEAARLYRLAAVQGDEAAQYNLANHYTRGAGVPQDILRAYMWYAIAASLDDEDAPYDRDTIAAQLTPGELAQGQAMVENCMGSNYADC